MAELTTLVIATHNEGKKKELCDLLTGFPVRIKSLNDFGTLPEVEESGNTFDQNAYLKAATMARILGLPALADDSGLIVEALDGAPGVHSARYAGQYATDEQRYMKLLKEMDGRNDRRAAFVCVVSIAVPTGAALTYEGRCEGLIAREPAGENGFGYDPIFYFPPLGRTFAQLSGHEKNKVSHRGKALKEIKAEFDKILVWIRGQMPSGDNSFCCTDSG